ncbi:MAG: hypothetical protein ACAH88_00085, partial [Roseimicrobium sp.]
MFARLVDVLDEMATIVVQNGYTADAAWTLLRHNLDKEARELTRLMSGWSNGVGALLQRYARDMAQVDQQVYIATDLRQKPEETAFSFKTRLYKLCKPFPTVYSEEKMLKLFHERLRNEWCARNAVLVTRLTRATSVAEVKSLLTEHSEVMSSHGGGGAANDGGRGQRHRQGGGGQNHRGGQGAGGGGSGGKGSGGPRNQGGSGASHDGGQAKSPKKGDKQGVKQDGTQGGKPTSKRCFNCNEAGHFANDCPYPRNHGDRGGGGNRVNTVGPPCKVNIVLTTTGAMEVVAELDSGTRYHLMSESTANQLGLAVESGSAEMPPEGLKGANGSTIRVVGSARVPLVWGGTVETFVFHICEDLVYPLVGYLALKGRNDWGHVDGRTTELILSGVEFAPDGGAYRAKVLTARQLAGLANLPTANEPDLDSKWLRPPETTVGEIPVRIVTERVQTYAETDAVVAAAGAATPKKVRWADMPSPMTVVQRHADDDIVGFVRNAAPTTYVHVVTEGATLGVTKPGDGIECHLDPDLAADMTPAQHKRLAEILTAMAENTKKVLTSPPKDQGGYNFRIRLRPGEDGAFEPRRRMNEHQAKLAYQLFDELSATGRMIAMEAREARHIMNLTFPAKKDGSLRPCIDSRLLNKKLVVEPVNVPSVREIRDQMDPKAKVFAIVDLANGFNLLPVAKESIPYCCVWGPKGEVWAYTVMTFGYTTAPQHFRDFTDFVLRGLPHTYTYV